MRKISRFTRIGDRFLLEIDHDLLALSGIDPTEPVEIEMRTGQLLIEPVMDEADRARLRAILDEMHRKYGGMMQRLADSGG